MLLNKQQRKDLLKTYEKKFKRGQIKKEEFDEMKTKIKQMGQEFALEHLRNIEISQIESYNSAREAKYKMYLEMYKGDESKAKAAVIESEKKESIRLDKKLFR